MLHIAEDASDPAREGDRARVHQERALQVCNARVLGAFYMRLTGTDIDVYQYLEPLYNDCRKLRRKLADGSFALTHVDEVIEELLTSDYWCDICLAKD